MRENIEKFESGFAEIASRWRAMIRKAGWPSPASPSLIRSAAKVEQTFGGMNAQLWDDPFEWTLPEALGSIDKALEYLDEVERARGEGMARIRYDEELTREIRTPSGSLTLATLLWQTLKEAKRLADEAEEAIGI
jgi:hypothetical protein